MRSNARPPAVIILMVLMALQGLSGLAGGFGLAADPSGASLGMPVAWLDGSPFQDYLIPGIILLSVLGLGPLIVLYGLWNRKRWAWSGSLAVAVSLIVWITVEIAIIGYQPNPPLQLVYGLISAVMLFSVLVPSVRIYYVGARYGVTSKRQR